ncbi:MAG: TRAP transporter substrate-binding protein [Sedimentibacter sp.]|uniref:TRAP transporter substrate-binding protein n=1 Tax=Sedimentibacter sp. TaxID=1960295 RepID=UPI0031592FBA
MKKIVSIVLSVLLVLSLVACGGSSAGNTQPSSSNETSGGNASAGNETVYKWKAANVLAPGAPWDLGLLEFSRLLKEKSGGKIELTVYSGGQLGGERDTMEGLQMGTVDFAIGSSATLSNFTDTNNIWDLPYLFPSKAAARGVLDSEIGQEVLDSLSKVGIKGLSYWENGLYAIGSKEPIKSLADMKGKKIRAIESKLQTDVFSSFGATAVVIAWGDIYTSLQQGVCDGVDSTTVPNMYSAKFHEVAPNITLTNHGYSPAPLLMSQKLWDSLPADIQAIILEAAQEAKLYERNEIDKVFEKAKKEMESAGATFYEINADEWSAAVKTVYEKYVGTMGIEEDMVNRVKEAAAKFN